MLRFLVGHLKRSVTAPVVRSLLLAHLPIWLLAIALGGFRTYGWSLTTLEVLWSGALLVALLNLVHQWAGTSRPLLVAGNAGVIYVIGALWIFAAAVGGEPDYAVIAENVSLAFDPGTYELLGSTSGLGIAVAVLFCLALPFLLERRLGFLAGGFGSPSWPGRVAWTTLYAGLLAPVLLTPLRSFEGVSGMIGSAYEYHVRDARARLDAERAAYPYVSYHQAPSRRHGRPHVFMILMESYNGFQTDRRLADGREITPFLNRVAREGLYVEQFYGNSVQTARGFLSILCSAWPSYKGKVFVQFSDTELRCLPEILQEHGYRTRFYHNSNDLGKEGIGPFLRANGFDEAYAIDSSFVADHERERFLWGFGDALQDDVLFARVLGKLDEAYGDEPPPHPTFTVIATGSHHRTFRWVPPEERSLFPDPQDQWEWFATSLNTFDRYLASFFEMLASSPFADDVLVVLVGDHGMPAGEHGSYHNAKNFYEENFRTPLIFWAPGRIAPRRVLGRGYAHIDIMPTVLDHLGISTWSHMLGQSMLRAGGTEPRPVVQIQPYDGRSIGAVLYPYKFVQHQASGREYFFDLAADPDESRNLIFKPPAPGVLDRLRDQVREVHRHQALIERNGLWDERFARLPPCDGSVGYRVASRTAADHRPSRPGTAELPDCPAGRRSSLPALDRSDRVQGYGAGAAVGR